jgi:hypothetical protein
MGFYIKSMPNKHTTQEFIEKSKLIHGSKYDYSKVAYIGSKFKVTILCITHGEFEQKPNYHLSGHGCVRCSNIANANYKINKCKQGRLQLTLELPLNTKAIMLTKGAYAIVDEEDYQRLSQYNWCLAARSHTDYAANYTNNCCRLLHREVLKLSKGEPMVDHINHNGLDNRKCNLRLCTRNENAYNSLKKGKNTSSKYKGVCFDKNRDKWTASICKDKVRLNIGRFDTEIEAAKSYNEKAVELHGEFSYINII